MLLSAATGAAMSVGRISTFLDCYIERDLKKGILTEEKAQELVDHIVMKFRMVRFARIEFYSGLRAVPVENKENNIKITRIADLRIAEAVI